MSQMNVSQYVEHRFVGIIGDCNVDWSTGQLAPVTVDHSQNGIASNRDNKWTKTELPRVIEQRACMTPTSYSV